MSNTVITRDSDLIKNLLASMEKATVSLDKLETECKPCLNGECYLTDSEVAEKLKISRRTLLEYRSEGIISYIQLEGKILYRASDVDEMLEKQYRKAYSE